MQCNVMMQFQIPGILKKKNFLTFKGHYDPLGLNFGTQSFLGGQTL